MSISQAWNNPTTALVRVDEPVAEMAHQLMRVEPAQLVIAQLGLHHRGVHHRHAGA
jgi:hypothetical protein